MGRWVSGVSAKWDSQHLINLKITALHPTRALTHARYLGLIATRGGLLTYKRYVEQFVTSAEGTILASNVLDGVALGLHGIGVASDLLKDAFKAGGEITALPHEEFFRRVEDVVLGREPGKHNYLERWEKGDPLPVSQSVLSLVWPVGVLQRLPSRKDHRRFSRLTGVMRAPGTNWIQAIAGLPPSERYFSPATRASFGQAFVWFTTRSALDAALAKTRRGGQTEADICRDVLGLIHHQPSKVLVALHLPASVIARRSSARPSFIEANSHGRFSARHRDPAVLADDPFGRTIDLASLADGAGLQNGLPERVTLALKPDDFGPDERIGFDILGPVSLARGQSRVDDIAAFAKLLRDQRSRPALIGALV